MYFMCPTVLKVMAGMIKIDINCKSIMLIIKHVTGN